MAAPAYRSRVIASDTDVTSVNVDKPANTANNDILILWVYWESNSTLTCTPPSGFAEISACAADNTGPNPDQHARAYWKRASGEGSSYTVSVSASVPGLSVNLAAYSGCVTSGTPVEAGNKVTGNSTSCTLPSITTLTADTLIVGHAFSYDWDKTWSSTALTERWDNTGSAGYDASQASAGASGTKLITQSGTDQFAGQIFNLASTAASGTQYTSSPAGTLTTAGTVVNRAGKPVSGALTTAGVVVKSARKVTAGALTSAGTLFKRAGKTVTGELSTSGVVAAVKMSLVALAGELASAGVVIARANKAIGGTVTSVGILINRTRKPLMGTLPSAGDVLKRTGKILSGELTSSGVAAAVKTALQVLGGTLTSAGTLTLRTGKSLTGMVTSSGSVIIQTAKSLAGALASAGELVGAKSGIYIQELAGTLTTAGEVARKTAMGLAGTLGSAGEVIKQTTKGLAGTLSSSGALATARLYLSVVGGTLTSAGALAVRAGKSLSGAIMPEGGIARAIAHVLAGILTPVGDISITSTAAIVTSARRRRYTPHRDEILYNLVNTMGGTVRLYNTLRKPRKR